MEHLSYEEKVSWDLISMQRSRLWRDLIVALRNVEGIYKIDKRQTF